MSILDKIVETKRLELSEAKSRTSEEAMAEAARREPPARDFAGALAKPGLSVIAEIKRASPSAGIIREEFDPVSIAKTYEEHGASALSVLTDVQYFHGALEYLRVVRGVVSLPLLRKDFTLEPYHLFEARCAGADAVLLIAAILDDAMMRELIALADELGLAALVEVHDPAESDRALAAGAKILGVNNRDLKTFVTDLAQTERVLEHMATREGLTIVSESGIKTPGDVKRLRALDVDAILVGEAFMREPNPGVGLATLMEQGDE